MAWNYDDSEIDGIVDSNLKSSPPNAPGVNTAAVVRALLKAFWRGIRGQVSQAVTSMDAVQASFVTRSLSHSATCYVQGDVGNDSRTGEAPGTGSNGAVKTLARVAALHSNKTQNLFIEIRSGTVDVTAIVLMTVPEVMIFVRAGATLRFKKNQNVRDSANVYVGEGTYSLKCFSNVVNVRNDGSLDVEAHVGSSGAGDQSYYRSAQGAIAICSNETMTRNGQFQSISLSVVENVTVGNNALLFATGISGTNNQGSSLARYTKKILAGGKNVILATGATESALEADKPVETLVFEGSGASKTVNIRRSYAFYFEIVYNDGCTISTQPAVNCSANVNNSLTFSGAVGKTVTVRLTQI